MDGEYDNASHSAFTNLTTNDLTHVVSGDNRILMGYIYSATDNVTGATYNGVAMTFVSKLLMVGAAAGQYLHCYILVNPTSGSNTFSVTSSSGLGGYLSAVSYKGMKQSGQPDGNTTQAVTSTTSLTTSLTTIADRCWLVGYAYHNTAVGAGTATTLRGGSVTVLQAMDSGGAKTPEGSHSLNTTASPTDFAGHIVVSLSPANSSNSRLLMMGVG